MMKANIEAIMVLMTRNKTVVEKGKECSGVLSPLVFVADNRDTDAENSSCSNEIELGHC